VVKRAVVACWLCASLARAQVPDGGAEPVRPAPVPVNANANANANVLAGPEPAPRPLVKRPVFWIALVGGLGIVAAGIGIAIAFNPAHDPSATWGVGVGN